MNQVMGWPVLRNLCSTLPVHWTSLTGYVCIYMFHESGNGVACVAQSVLHYSAKCTAMLAKIDLVCPSSSSESIPLVLSLSLSLSVSLSPLLSLPLPPLSLSLQLYSR